jgi:hypothetical protein
MTRKITRHSFFAAMVGLAALGGVVAAGAHDLQSVQLALAGANNSWPSGDCDRVEVFDHESYSVHTEMLCWGSDYALSLAGPGVR